MKKKNAFILLLVFLVSGSYGMAEVVYVDGIKGNDSYLGTQEQPLATIGRAVSMVNVKTETGPTVIKIGPGVYSLKKSIILKNNRPYTEKDRLTIDATILPDDPLWEPSLMPIILSVEDPRQAEKMGQATETYSIQIGISHVTICGLRFLGNPLLKNWHACISRAENGLDDLLVTKCMFVGDTDSCNIYCAALGTGDRFVVDHCVFYRCHAATVYWDARERIGGKGCAMRYCIVDGSVISGVWTCQTNEDFSFYHNVVTRCEYLWMRKSGDTMKYSLQDCVITNNKYNSGYGAESGPVGQTGPEVVFDEKNVIKAGEVELRRDKKAKDYLHVIPDTLGSDLGAGLFTK